MKPCNSLLVIETSLANHITCLPHPPLQKVFPQMLMMMKQDMRQNSNCKAGHAIHAEMMGDIMNFHHALKQLDASIFVQAVVKEVNGHVNNKHWELIKHSDLPKNVEIVPSVQPMHHKHNLMQMKSKSTMPD